MKHINLVSFIALPNLVGFNRHKFFIIKFYEKKNSNMRFVWEFDIHNMHSSFYKTTLAL